ncbi:hypothetical protein WA026_007827 [Henosepilachna vigintioctopunctata]|uniref:Uncharacterized protein n=1 Tax=Henosepilachna vigintioctopunctata TaxID=420089 RepID=A0AAW1U448_9CUCU
MPACAICTNPVNKKSPGPKCGGKCQHFLHANGKCSDITKSQLSVITSLPGSNWTCEKCRNVAATTITDPSDIDAADDISDGGEEGNRVILQQLMIVELECIICQQKDNYAYYDLKKR